MRFKFYIKEEEIKTAKRIIILTSKPEEDVKKEDIFKTAKKLLDQARGSGIEPFLVYAEDAYLKREKEKTIIYNLNEKQGFEIDADDTIVICRRSVEDYLSSMDLVSQLEKMGYFCINSRECIEDCQDKYRTYLRLKELGVETPRTALVRSEEGLEKAFDDVGGKFPVVLKTLTGSKGLGVFIAESLISMKSTLQTIWKLSESEILMQEYIESDGDLRIHVLGDQVIAGMKRFKIKDDFRSNFSLGGKIKPVKISDETAAIAIKANKAVKGTWTGVDIIKDKSGKQYVLEVNASPGTDGIEKATGKNIVKMVLDFAKNSDNWSVSTIECGWKEYIFVKGIGKVKAKFDTGNGAYCVIHSNGWKVKDGNVIWNFDGKKITSKLIDMVSVVIGHNAKEERPLINLEIEFNGKKYEEEFTVDNREDRPINKKAKSKVLISRHFIKKARLSVNPAKLYVLSIPEEEEEKKK